MPGLNSTQFDLCTVVHAVDIASTCITTALVQRLAKWLRFQFTNVSRFLSVLGNYRENV